GDDANAALDEVLLAAGADAGAEEVLKLTGDHSGKLGGGSAARRLGGSAAEVRLNVVELAARCTSRPGYDDKLNARWPIMTDMGTFRTTIMIESAERRGEMRTVDSALVDTGSEYTWVPAELLGELGIRPEHVQRFIVEDGRQLERSVGIAIVHAAGAQAPESVVLAERGERVLPCAH